MYGMCYDDNDMRKLKEDILSYMIGIDAMNYEHALHKFVDRFIDSEISQHYWHIQIDPNYEDD